MGNVGVKGAGWKTYQESRCKGRGGSGCCCPHRCWAPGPGPHSADCGLGLHPQCTRSTGTTVTSLLWVVGWEEVNCLSTLWWGLEGSLVLPNPGPGVFSTWAGLRGTQCLLRVQPQADVLAWGGRGARAGPGALIVATTAGG